MSTLIHDTDEFIVVAIETVPDTVWLPAGDVIETVLDGVGVALGVGVAAAPF